MSRKKHPNISSPPPFVKLKEPDAPVSRLERQFRYFNARNPQVYQTLVRLCREARAKGDRLGDRLKGRCCDAAASAMLERCMGICREQMRMWEAKIAGADEIHGAAYKLCAAAAIDCERMIRCTATSQGESKR